MKHSTNIAFPSTERLGKWETFDKSGEDVLSCFCWVTCSGVLMLVKHTSTCAQCLACIRTSRSGDQTAPPNSPAKQPCQAALPNSAAKAGSEPGCLTASGLGYRSHRFTNAAEKPLQNLNIGGIQSRLRTGMPRGERRKKTETIKNKQKATLFKRSVFSVFCSSSSVVFVVSVLFRWASFRCARRLPFSGFL